MDADAGWDWRKFWAGVLSADRLLREDGPAGHDSGPADDVHVRHGDDRCGDWWPAVYVRGDGWRYRHHLFRVHDLVVGGVDRVHVAHLHPDSSALHDCGGNLDAGLGPSGHERHD